MSHAHNLKGRAMKAQFKILAAALAIVFASAFMPATAQYNNFNPTKEAVQEDKLLQQLKY